MSPQRISRRIGAISPSATLAVDSKAKALKAAGEPVIGFGAGEPDFPTPAKIVEAAAQACQDPSNHKYSPVAGLPELREALAIKTKRDSGLEISADQVLVTNGGKHAVYNTFATLLDPGDEATLRARHRRRWLAGGGLPRLVPVGDDPQRLTGAQSVSCAARTAPGCAKL